MNLLKFMGCNHSLERRRSTMKWTAFATLGLAAIIAACTSTPAPTTDKPVIQFFKASPDTSQTPGTITLSWEVTGASKLEIDGGIGTVTGDKNSKALTVNSTSSFTLTATNDKGSSAKSAIVEINVPDKLPMYLISVGLRVRYTLTWRVRANSNRKMNS